MTRALVFLAPGFEEIEACTIIDVLRRCNIRVIIAGLAPGFVEGSHGIKFDTDRTVAENRMEDIDAVICPGGGLGTENLRKNQKVLDIVKTAFESNKLVAAICAAPAVLSDAGILRHKICTIYPGMESELVKGGGKPSMDIVVVDDNIITSKGPATALPFALAIAEKLAGKKAAEEVGKKMLADMVLK
ncbi:MAG: DJ-1/PfpI family protein [Candidatus Bathyarchaeota archaeon]|nr:MAG: DJ-1/PfpI family protein [Candidatus Bathyarchaeota archaeon]